MLHPIPPANLSTRRLVTPLAFPDETFLFPQARNIFPVCTHSHKTPSVQKIKIPDAKLPQARLAQLPHPPKFSLTPHHNTTPHISQLFHPSRLPICPHRPASPSQALHLAPAVGPTPALQRTVTRANRGFARSALPRCARMRVPLCRLWVRLSEGRCYFGRMGEMEVWFEG